MPSHNPAHIAVVEDDPIMGESLVQRLTLEGYDTVWWRSGRAALDGIRRDRPDLVVCDIRLPDMDGEAVFREILPDLSTSPVLFITAYGSIDQAVRLIRAGADDYVTKPFRMDEFLGRVDHLLQRRPSPAPESASVLGESEPMRRVEALLRRIANIDSTLLLTGESGAGKEVAARFVHEISRRAESPFIAVNCAAIPSDLLESELFGHEKGAFTGAHARHEGYAERARDGILFLDEVSELTPAVQAKLLRLVQDRVFLRLGGERSVPFNARLICATNANLTDLIAAGRFRRDLYFRINVIPVDIPPLRSRVADIVPLLRHYVGYFAAAFGSDVRGVTTQAEAVASVHDWPGNVRELRNRAERAVALAGGPWVSACDLFPDCAIGDEPEAEVRLLSAVRDDAERRHILAVLERTGGQVKKAADLLGISRTTLWEKMRRLGVKSDEQSDSVDES
jgi:DNA-binding NtrC family response regulator